MKSWVLLAGLLALVAGCRFDAGGVSYADDGGDGDGTGEPADAGEPTDAGPPDAPPCTPQCVDDDHLNDCSGGAPVECLLGCENDTEIGHCAVLTPSNGATSEHLDGVTAGLDVPTGAAVVVDTMTGKIVNGVTTVRAAGTGVIAGIGFRVVNGAGIFAVSALSVAPGGVLFGRGENALLVLSADDVLIRGTIDVSAACRGDGPIATDDVSCGGPGGGGGSVNQGFAKGCAPGSDGDGDAGSETGGGGGGMRENGQSGGPSSGAIAGQGGQVGDMCPGETLVPLRGGSGGGQGGGEGMVAGGRGGGGGGAVQITSFTRIDVQKQNGSLAGVLAQGGGGEGGGPSFGGGGGGSGGAILLEAPVVQLVGATLAANGGGGGQGSGLGRGETGQPRAARAEGGGGNSDGHGGDGGSAAGPATAGFGNSMQNFDGTGGGGGAAGRVRVNALDFASSGGSVISPAASTGEPVAD